MAIFVYYSRKWREIKVPYKMKQLERISEAMVILYAVPPAGAAALPSAIPFGPLGWLAVGAATDSEGISWDCWRDILHDFESPALENPHGRLIKDLQADPRVKEFRIEEEEDQAPFCWLKNQWNEEFRIDFVRLPDGEIAGHAVRIKA